MRNFIALLFLSLLLSCSSTGNRLSKLSLTKAVDGEHRSEDFKKRDQYRHPKETLEFFGIAPEMTVVEIWPSGGWYTQILAPYLATKGQYIIAAPPSDLRGYTKKRKEWMSKHP